jgi:polyribonucleotide nucleotidyltransferase
LAKHCFDVPVGRSSFRFETGHVAAQANAALIVRYGDVVLLCCVTMSKKQREGIDFFPLMCDYEERMYAAGKFPGGFIKREGRPSEKAVLTSRMIDRPIRPRFPEHMRNDVQVVVTALSADSEHTADVAAINGASLALHISDIPYDKPVAAVRIGVVDGSLVVNPTQSQLKDSPLDLLVAGTADRINMIETEASEVSEKLLAEGLELAHREIAGIVAHFERIRSEIGKPKWELPEAEDAFADFRAELKKFASPKIAEIIPADGKVDLWEGIDALVEECRAQFAVPEGEPEPPVEEELKKLIKEYARKFTFDKGIRVDGRSPGDVRPIEAEVHFLPRVHGSAMFKRGQTQVISCVTLGTYADQQKIDIMEFDDFKRYMHHYNFPPFSVGEVKPLRGPGRRDIGHGALAEKALVRMIPDEEEYPYSIRVVSEVVESNASSSMASVCGSTMALLDAGVPLKTMVAGISIGLITEGEKWLLLRDLSGFEDFNGDMDFKVAGTDRGITAIQLDVKIEGLTLEMIKATLEEARQGRLHILGEMRKVIDRPKSAEELSPYIPVLDVIRIDVDKIGAVIGPSGKTIKKLCADYEAQIDISEDGLVFVLGKDRAKVKAAVDTIRAMTTDIEEGMEFNGKVVRITEFGAFIELTPGNDGLLHISQIADRRLERVEEELSMGDIVPVRVKFIDDSGKIDLVRTDVTVSRERHPRKQGGGGPPRGGGRGDRGDRPRGGDRGESRPRRW